MIVSFLFIVVIKCKCELLPSHCTERLLFFHLMPGDPVFGNWCFVSGLGMSPSEVQGQIPSMGSGDEVPKSWCKLYSSDLL